MQQFPFWQIQKPGEPIFTDILWNKPERREQSGRLGIIGGNKLGFAGVAESYSTALKTGIGEARILLPDVLKKSIPTNITEARFTPSNLSGSLSRDALPDMRALAEWANGILLIGDAGRSSETAIVYDDFIRDYEGVLILTRDAIDLISSSHNQILERKNTLFVASFAQVQKLFRSVYYPKMLTFSMQLLQFVDSLHKFTVTHPVTIATLHKDTIIIANRGKVITMEWTQPLKIWRGNTASIMAVYYLWNPSKPLEAISAGITE